MKNFLTCLFVVLPLVVFSQHFVPVWESLYLPGQETGCYVSSIDIKDEAIGLVRFCEGEREVVFGNIPEELWIECDIPDSLGEVLKGLFIGETLFITTSSGWFCSINEICSIDFLAEFDGYVGMERFSDTLFFYGGSVNIDGDIFSEIFSFEPVSGEWNQIVQTEKENVFGLKSFEGKLFSVVLEAGKHKIMKLDSLWEVFYVFPEGEYFISWTDGGDKIYVSSTSFSPPVEYGILSEFKDDGDMDSLFASDGNILAIEVTDCFVFVSGSFTNFGNFDAENLAMFERFTKEIIQTDRGLDGNGYAISANDEFVYVGGAFMYGADIRSPGIISLPSCYEDGIEDFLENEIRIFPNPVTEFLVIENGVGKDVRIFSLSEELYLMSNEADNRKVFDCFSLPTGTYYVLIEGKVFSFIKI